MKHSESELRDALIGLCKSIIPPDGAIYVAGPVDTGELYYKQEGDSLERGDDIRSENLKKIDSLVNRLRNSRDVPVINPGILQIPGWSPRQIGDLFMSIIKKFVKEVWFVDGWEYSHGATKEFLYCCKRSIDCFDENANIITSKRARKLISNAIDDISNEGKDTTKLEKRINSIKEIE